jgi:hypothetical protein
MRCFFSGGCQNGGSYGQPSEFRIGERNLSWDCAVKTLGLGNVSAATTVGELEKYIIEPECIEVAYDV